MILSISHSNIDSTQDWTFSLSTLTIKSSAKSAIVSKSTELFIPTGIQFKIKTLIISFAGTHIFSDNSFTLTLSQIIILSFFFNVSETFNFLSTFLGCGLDLLICSSFLLIISDFLLILNEDFLVSTLLFAFLNSVFFKLSLLDFTGKSSFFTILIEFFLFSSLFFSSFILVCFL